MKNKYFNRAMTAILSAICFVLAMLLIYRILQGFYSVRMPIKEGTLITICSVIGLIYLVYIFEHNPKKRKAAARDTMLSKMPCSINEYDILGAVTPLDYVYVNMVSCLFDYEGKLGKPMTSAKFNANMESLCDVFAKKFERYPYERNSRNWAVITLCEFFSVIDHVPDNVTLADIRQAVSPAVLSSMQISEYWTDALEVNVRSYARQIKAMINSKGNPD